jgi:branched-chain amino acid transport system ATP-binding protein
MSVLVVRDVHTYYSESYVLQGLSLEVTPGRVAVLMGRNGVGKTTTVRTIMGLTPPRRGSITFDGEEISRLPTRRIARRGVGLVPQGRRVFPSLTVREHLYVAAFGAAGEPAWTIERVLDLFPPLKARLNQRAQHLSGGEQSMLAIARALRTGPRCLLMDEPTEGLAPVYVEIVLGVIDDLRRHGDLSLLVVVPELPLALAIADHVYVMTKGRMVFEGTPAELERRKEIQEQHIGIG